MKKIIFPSQNQLRMHFLSHQLLVALQMRAHFHEGWKNRYEAWNHFIQLEPKSDKKAQCKYCDALIRYEKGITSMRNHVLRCPNNPNNEVNKRRKASASSTIDGNINSPSCGRFD